MQVLVMPPPVLQPFPRYSIDLHFQRPQIGVGTLPMFDTEIPVGFHLLIARENDILVIKVLLYPSYLCSI